MTHKQWALVALIAVSALSLVNARYHERRLFTLFERAERASEKLNSDIEVLQVELTALRNPTRIDALARRDLGMAPINPTQTLYSPELFASGQRSGK
jgi:cell division protein FtsL